MAKPAARSLLQTLKRYMTKKPWEITGTCADPEYWSSLPNALEYRPTCSATPTLKPVVPNSHPDTVFDIKYFSRDQSRNRPPVARTVLRKPDVERMMQDKAAFDVADFSPVYLTGKVEEDMNARGGGYQK